MRGGYPSHAAFASIRTPDIAHSPANGMGVLGFHCERTAKRRSVTSDCRGTVLAYLKPMEHWGRFFDALKQSAGVRWIGPRPCSGRTLGLDTPVFFRAFLLYWVSFRAGSLSNRRSNNFMSNRIAERASGRGLKCDDGGCCFDDACQAAGATAGSDNVGEGPRWRRPFLGVDRGLVGEVRLGGAILVNGQYLSGWKGWAGRSALVRVGFR